MGVQKILKDNIFHVSCLRVFFSGTWPSGRVWNNLQTFHLHSRAMQLYPECLPVCKSPLITVTLFQKILHERNMWLKNCLITVSWLERTYIDCMYAKSVFHNSEINKHLKTKGFAKRCGKIIWGQTLTWTGLRHFILCFLNISLEVNIQTFFCECMELFITG